MKYADYFRRLARRCCLLSKTAVDPEVIEQMRVWTVDFADEADEAERRAVESERLIDAARTLRRTDGQSGSQHRAGQGGSRLAFVGHSNWKKR
jgi:hypothetical protein